MTREELLQGIADAMMTFVRENMPPVGVPRAVCVAMLVDAERVPGLPIDEGLAPCNWKVGLSLLAMPKEHEDRVREHLAAQLLAPEDDGTPDPSTVPH